MHSADSRNGMIHTVPGTRIEVSFALDREAKTNGGLGMIVGRRDDGSAWPGLRISSR